MALTVRKRGEIWHARGTVRYNDQVVTVREFSTGCSTRGSALLAASGKEREIQADLAAGPEGRARNLTIAECIAAYAHKPGGVKSYDAARLADFNDRIGDRRVSEALAAWADWMGLRGAKFSPGTAARNRTILQAAISYGCRERGFEAPRLPRVSQPVAEGVIYLPYKVQLRLLASYNRHARQVAIMLCYQGMRTSEALSLEWSALDFDRKTIFVVKSKSGHSRTVPMHPVVERRLRRAWVARGRPGAGRVFLSSRGDPYRVAVEADGDAQGGNPLTRAHKTACRRAGVVGFRIHDWRHHFASHMVMSGASLVTIMKLGGWRTASMVQRYAAVSADHLSEAISRMR